MHVTIESYNIISRLNARNDSGNDNAIGNMQTTLHPYTYRSTILTPPLTPPYPSGDNVYVGVYLAYR
mgnify:CR=1 FL=1